MRCISRASRCGRGGGRPTGSRALYLSPPMPCQVKLSLRAVGKVVRFLSTLNRRLDDPFHDDKTRIREAEGFYRRDDLVNGKLGVHKGSVRTCACACARTCVWERERGQGSRVPCFALHPKHPSSWNPFPPPMVLKA